MCKRIKNLGSPVQHQQLLPSAATASCPVAAKEHDCKREEGEKENNCFIPGSTVSLKVRSTPSLTCLPNFL